ALLPGSACDAYRHLVNGLGFETLLDWGETSLGAVTGSNDFFAMTRTGAAELGLKEAELLRISPPGARHLRGLSFTERAWEQLARAGDQCYLFAPPTDLPSLAGCRYIELGENAGVHNAYKCRKRRPWWRVPLVPKPDLLFTYMNYDRPRLISNQAGVYLLNSLYGVTLNPERRKLGREMLPVTSLNSVTLLGAEMVGRAYGGGLLKHEPREADLLPVPSFEALRWIGRDLRSLAPRVAALLRQNDLAAAVELVDNLILEKCLGSTSLSIDALREARAILFRRRQVRSRGESSTGRELGRSPAIALERAKIRPASKCPVGLNGAVGS
ncbi:MAG: hypothetical protein ACREFQ_11495, partial [Stellaceae bacterium]